MKSTGSYTSPRWIPNTPQLHIQRHPFGGVGTTSTPLRILSLIGSQRFELNPLPQRANYRNPFPPILKFNANGTIRPDSLSQASQAASPTAPPTSLPSYLYLVSPFGPTRPEHNFSPLPQLQLRPMHVLAGGCRRPSPSLPNSMHVQHTESRRMLNCLGSAQHPEDILGGLDICDAAKLHKFISSANSLLPASTYFDHDRCQVAE